MTDDPLTRHDIDADFQPVGKPGEEIPGDFDQRGSLMREPESYERIIEGLKLASDGARHLAIWGEGPEWNGLAVIYDKVRMLIAKLGRFNRPSDTRDSLALMTDASLPRREAYARVTAGLKMASAGCSQMALAHRMDMRWSLWSEQLQRLRDGANALAKSKSAEWSCLWMPH